MNDFFVGNQNQPIAFYENQNGNFHEVLFRAMNETKTRKAEKINMDELERKSYECAKNEIQKLMIQNEELRDRVNALKLSLDAQEREIRNRNEAGDVLRRTFRELLKGDVAEVQLTFRTRRYFDG